MQAKIGNTLVSKIKPNTTPYEVNDTELRGFLLRVQPSGVISYYCAYRNRSGKRHRVLLGRYPAISPTQARDHAKRVLASAIQGDDPSILKKVVKTQTLGNFVEKEYGPWVCAHRKDGRATVARINASFAEFKDVKIADITPLTIERWRTKSAAEKKPATINRDLAALKSTLAKAVEWSLIAKHPLAGLKLAKLDSNSVVRFLSKPEEQRLRKELNTREERMRAERDKANAWRRERDYPEFPNLRSIVFADHLRPMVLISVNTGVRQGELFNLPWTSVDIKHATLTVAGSSAKSGKTRHLPLNSEALTTLKQWCLQQDDDTGLVFPSAEGKAFDNVNKAWHAVLEKAKIEKFRWHDLRHHFASRLVMAGVDLNTVRELLGHTNIEMTLRYAHLAPEHKAAAVAKLIG